MPSESQYAKSTYQRKAGHWAKRDIEKSFDYEGVDQKSAAFMISVFRWYPDFYADLCRAEDARYHLELPQRMMLRVIARYRNVYITGVRGLTKTYCLLLGKMIKGELWPGCVMRYCAPNLKQAAALATQAFHQIEKDYPIIASHWSIKHDAQDSFLITTIYGSEFGMYSPRGDNNGETLAEEIGQEGNDPFDMRRYEEDVLPACRMVRMVNGIEDPYSIQQQHIHISNACRKQNPAFHKHRATCLKEMQSGEPYEGYVMDLSWKTALLCNIRNIAYVKDQRSRLTEAAWKREMCGLYTGDSENPLIPDEKLTASRRNMLMEPCHCGDPHVIYIVSHDVSYADNPKNAKCADVVLKLTLFEDIERRDKYRKQVVYVDNYPPPKTDYLQAQRVRALWERFNTTGGQATYLVVDAQSYGTGVVEELMKPTSDGSPTLCCVNHMAFQSIEQPGSLPVIYPMKATARGGTDSDSDMISYAQLAFDHEDIELLTANIIDGVEAYKLVHRIKDARQDSQIILPYRQCELLCQQISNLQAEVSGMSLKEVRKSKAMQRDIWSALKYALRMAQKLEGDMKILAYRPKSSWSDKIEEVRKSGVFCYTGGSRGNVLAMRSKVR